MLLPGEIISVVYATADVITIIAIATITVTNKICNLFMYREQYVNTDNNKKMVNEIVVAKKLRRISVILFYAPA